MEASANVLAHVDAELKTQAEAILERDGVSVSGVITMLYGWIILQNGVPQEVQPQRHYPVRREGMSTQEIEEAFQRSQEAILAQRSTPAERAHDRLRRDFRVPRRHSDPVSVQGTAAEAAGAERELAYPSGRNGKYAPAEEAHERPRREFDL